MFEVFIFENQREWRQMKYIMVTTKHSFVFKLQVLKIPKLEEWRSYLVNSSLTFYEMAAHVSKYEIILIERKHTALNFLSFHDLRKAL